MKKCLYFLLLLLHFSVFAQKNCTVKNETFAAGEHLQYKVHYSWGAIWLLAAEGGLITALKEVNGKTVYHFTGYGGTYPKYDWIYKVRDKYESFADTSTLKPIRFIREANEGGNYTYDDYVFSSRKNKIYTNEKRNKKPGRLDSINITPCTIDILTAVSHVRCMDFSQYKSNDTIPITLVLDGKIYSTYIRYLGKEIIKTELLGKVRCIKFRPKLIEGSLFKAGEEMTVWVTDDKNRMPVYVETPILVGTIKVHLFKFSNLRNKTDCVVSE